MLEGVHVCGGFCYATQTVAGSYSWHEEHATNSNFGSSDVYGVTFAPELLLIPFGWLLAAKAVVQGLQQQQQQPFVHFERPRATWLAHQG